MCLYNKWASGVSFYKDGYHLLLSSVSALLAFQMCCCDTLTNCWAAFHKLKRTKTLLSRDDKHTPVTPASSVSGVGVWSRQSVSPCSRISPISCCYDPLITVSVQCVITVRQAHQLGMRSSLFDRECICVSAIRFLLIRPATSCSLIAHLLPRMVFFFLLEVLIFARTAHIKLLSELYFFFALPEFFSCLSTLCAAIFECVKSNPICF